MRLYGKAQEVAEDILKAFQEGSVPEALAQVFIHRRLDCPSESWSWRNRLIAALHGHYDARGYRQWIAAGRQVKKGERAFRILVPRYRKAAEDDEDLGSRERERALVGFLAAAVFGYDQTEGEPLAGAEEEAAFLAALPLVEVARSWDLTISTFPGAGSPKLGYYRHGQAIGLGVENLATWAHELVHAADDRTSNLNRRPGQQLDNEVVAEFGGAVLLECLGYEVESDRGGAFRYIEHYAKKHERSVLGVCTELLERTCAAVDLLLETADQLASVPADQSIAAA